VAQKRISINLFETVSYSCLNHKSRITLIILII